MEPNDKAEATDSTALDEANDAMEQAKAAAHFRPLWFIFALAGLMGGPCCQHLLVPV